MTFLHFCSCSTLVVPWPVAANQLADHLAFDPADLCRFSSLSRRRVQDHALAGWLRRRPNAAPHTASLVRSKQDDDEEFELDSVACRPHRDEAPVISSSVANICPIARRPIFQTRIIITSISTHADSSTVQHDVWHGMPPGPSSGLAMRVQTRLSMMIAASAIG